MPTGPGKQTDLLNIVTTFLSKFVFRATFIYKMMTLFPVLLFGSWQPYATLDNKGLCNEILPQKVIIQI